MASGGASGGRADVVLKTLCWWTAIWWTCLAVLVGVVLVDGLLEDELVGVVLLYIELCCSHTSRDCCAGGRVASRGA